MPANNSHQEFQGNDAGNVKVFDHATKTFITINEAIAKGGTTSPGVDDDPAPNTPGYKASLAAQIEDSLPRPRPAETK